MTAIPSRVRQLVNGVWQYVTFDEGGGGGSQPFVRASLRHSADITNVSSNAPVVPTTGGNRPAAAITLPPTAFGDNGYVKATVYNDTGASVNVSGSLIVQNASGAVWLEQDTGPVTVATGDSADLDFADAGGGAGAGLAWNSTDKQIDIASAGTYSALVILDAFPA